MMKMNSISNHTTDRLCCYKKRHQPPLSVLLTTLLVNFLIALSSSDWQVSDATLASRFAAHCKEQHDLDLYRIMD
jgi:hypothetical protein